MGKVLERATTYLITLKDDFPEHHYLNISLATLKPADLKAQDNESSKNSEDDDREGKEKEQIKGKGKEKLTKLNLDRSPEIAEMAEIYKGAQI